MLETLRIQDYALIDELELEFGPGFNVLTGETGAGKSIILGALNLVLGARASSEAVRRDAKRAKVDALFRLPSQSPQLQAILEAHDIELDGEELFLSRVVTPEGRSRAYAAGSLVPVSVLAAIGDELMDLHGQHEHQSLLKLDRQRGLIDAYAGSESIAATLAERVSELRGIEKDIEVLEHDDREQARRMDFLRHEVEEIDAADLSPGEEEELRSRRNVINNAEQLVTLAGNIFAALYERDETPALDAIGTALSDLDALSEIDPRFRPLLEELESARAVIDNVAGEVRRFLDDFEYDPDELDDINARLSLIGGLKRKYGETIEDILAHGAAAADELRQFESKDERLALLRKNLASSHKKADELAKKLSKSRIKAGERLARNVEAGLQSLGMKGAVFEVRFERKSLDAHGIDAIEFLVAANAGEPAKTLRQVASGGEISRIMLALKSTLAESDAIGALVFDEIDAGVGGAVANHVAQRLRALSNSHQLIVISHLPQIASLADVHFRAEKLELDGRTHTRVHVLEGDERVREMARLLDGSVSDVSMEHARTLLEESRTTQRKAG